MSKNDEFYNRYAVAIFNRGRKKTLPKSYIEKQARSVLKEAGEMDRLFATMDAMAASGKIAIDGDEYTLLPDA